MKQHIGDQKTIAERFEFADAFTAETSRLALYKVSSYNLSLIKPSFSLDKEEIKDSIKKTLLNYVDLSVVLATSGFFDAEIEN